MSFNFYKKYICIIFINLYFSDNPFNDDIDIKKENLTSSGMNIRFGLSTKSTVQIICVDWRACSLDSY